MSDNTQQTSFKPSGMSDETEVESSGFDITLILNILRGRWYIFVISVALALLIGCYKIYSSTAIYSQSAAVLIKDSKSGSASGVEAFADLAGVTGLVNSNVENEMLILQSRSIMESVVKHLGLQYFYYEPGLLRSTELYDLSPVEVIPQSPDAAIAGASFTMTVLSDGTAEAKKFRYESSDTTFEAPFNTLITLPEMGAVTVHLKPQTMEWYLTEKGDKIEVAAADLQTAITYYLSALTVSQMQKESSLLSLEYSSTSPRKAADILNTLIDEYSKFTIQSKNMVLESSQEFIASRLEVISAELAEVDGRIEDYKRIEKTANPNDEAESFLSKADAIDERISDYEIQLRLVRDLNSFIASHSDSFEILPLNIGLNNTALNSQIIAYNELVVRYNRLLAASSEKNPVVGDNATALRSMRHSIMQTTSDMQHSIEMQISESRSMSHKTVGRVDAATANVRNLTSIERDQRIKSELYTYLLQKSEENAIMKSMTESNVRPIDAAYGSSDPVSPRRMRILAICFALGLCLPFGWFYVRDQMNTKVRGRSDVEAKVQAPIIGEIPSKPKTLVKQTVFVQQGATNQISEAFRILRTNMSFLDMHKNVKVIALTSTMPGEGKSYVSINLALTFAISGKKVCLLDLDLRKVSTSREFDMRGAAGISEYLSGRETNLSALIKPTEYDNLSILPGGIVPPNPAELLMSERFDAAIAELRTRFDYLIIDNPPYDVVADAGIANRVADLSIYVLRTGLLNRSSLPAIEDIYQQKKLRNMAIVLTDVDYESLYYSIGYSGYGKNYGYGSFNSAHTYYGSYATEKHDSKKK